MFNERTDEVQEIVLKKLENLHKCNEKSQYKLLVNMIEETSFINNYRLDECSNFLA